MYFYPCWPIFIIWVGFGAAMRFNTQSYFWDFGIVWFVLEISVENVSNCLKPCQVFCKMMIGQLLWITKLRSKTVHTHQCSKSHIWPQSGQAPCIYSDIYIWYCTRFLRNQMIIKWAFCLARLIIIRFRFLVQIYIYMYVYIDI